MLNGSLSTAIISLRSRWICRAQGWSNAYGFPLSNTWVIVGCFLLHVAIAWTWPVLALSLFIGEPYAAPDAVSTGVCGGCLCCTTLQFFCFLKRFRHKARNEPYFCQQHSLRMLPNFTLCSPGHWLLQENEEVGLTWYDNSVQFYSRFDTNPWYFLTACTSTSTDTNTDTSCIGGTLMKTGLEPDKASSQYFQK